MDFLEYLSSLAEVPFLSDLHRQTFTEGQIQEILALPEDLFPLSEYQEAIYYLFDLPTDVASIDEAKQILIQRMRQK